MNKKYKYLIAAFLIIASLIAYGRIIGNDFINYDDPEYIVENNNIKSGINAESIKWAFSAVVSSNWHPLTLLSHALDWSLFGANASGHHLVNLLLHIGSVLFLFFFLEKTTKSLWPSAFVAALFALHPLRVESVAWAAERKDVLSMFFGMATFYVYALYVENRKASKYLLCLTLFALGLMAKPMLVTLPFIMLLLDYWPLGRWQKALYAQTPPVAANNTVSLKKKHHKHNASPEKKLSLSIQRRGQLISNLLWGKLPFIFLAIVSSIVTIWAQHKAIASLEKVPFSDRIMNAIVSYVAYLVKTFWPVNMAVFYPYESSFPLWQVFGAAFILLGISAAVIYFIKKAPFLFVGWFWYLGTLVPVIGLVQVGRQSMADRYTYLPSIGITIILIWGILHLLPKEEKLRKIIIIPAGIIIISVLTFLTWQQCGYWKNSTTLFSHALLVTKDNYLAHSSLGVILFAEGKKDEAIDHYRAAININPNYDDAHYNLGNALKDQGKMEEALNEYRKTVRIRPSSADAHNNIGIILEMYLKKYDEAIYHYRQALQVDPNNPSIYFNIGIAMAKMGKLKEAEGHFREAIYLKPDYEEAHKALKITLDMAREQKR